MTVPPAPPAATPLPAATDLPDDRYLNRELSWLDFNARVLALAEDTSQPLLERAKFLAIFALEPRRVLHGSGRRAQAPRRKPGSPCASADGLTPREQLAQIAMRSRELTERQPASVSTSVRPELEKHDISFMTWSDLDDQERLRLSGYFSDHIFPVLTPLAVDPAHPFPYISNLSVNLAVIGA